jgi:signal transduction histidine kinase
MRSASPATDRQLLRLAGLALPATVWMLGILGPPRTGLTPGYVGALTALLAGVALVDTTLPDGRASRARRLLWLGAELALAFAAVQVHGSLIRGSLIYLLPASRALLLFGERPGLALSLGVWPAYALNVGIYAWPDRLGEFVNYFAFLLPLDVVSIVLTLATIRQAADRQRVQALYDELSAAHAELKALHARARETAVTEERNRIAREIHDTVAHYLTVVNVQLEAAEKLGEAQPERAIEQVRRARRLALDCLREVRRSVAALRTSSLEELSLPRALGKLVGDFSSSTGLDVQLHVDLPDDARLAPETAQTLYRTAQEGLTNVQRHAHAAHVRVSLQRQNGHLELAVQDDGVGPAADRADDGAGFGLQGLRERVALLGGDLAFGPARPRGTRLVVSVPIG